MEFRYYDRYGKQINSGELPRLQIWNPTMEHIFAAAVERLHEEEIPAPQPVAEE